ncbi:MAG: hypothetical protein HN982_11040 [Candidatus Marinimicrobia bacterium]|nr:hypothetical protein [Candidatus Neomarinimicrobiota bacterium]
MFMIAFSYVGACPFCAGQDNQFSDILIPVGLLLGSPFLVVGIFVTIVRKQNKMEEQSENE